MSRWAIALALGLLGTACSPGPTAVGDPCTDGTQCPTSASPACILAWPEGYCTEVACSLGSCPEGARCVSGIQFADVPFDAFCLATCQQPSDCRDRYRCVDVQQAEKVCAPALP